MPKKKYISEQYLKMIKSGVESEIENLFDTSEPKEIPFNERKAMEEQPAFGGDREKISKMISLLNTFSDLCDKQAMRKDEDNLRFVNASPEEGFLQANTEENGSYEKYVLDTYNKLLHAGIKQSYLDYAKEHPGIEMSITVCQDLAKYGVEHKLNKTEQMMADRRSAKYELNRAKSRTARRGGAATQEDELIEMIAENKISNVEAKIKKEEQEAKEIRDDSEALHNFYEKHQALLTDNAKLYIDNLRKIDGVPAFKNEDVAYLNGVVGAGLGIETSSEMMDDQPLSVNENLGKSFRSYNKAFGKNLETLQKDETPLTLDKKANLLDEYSLAKRTHEQRPAPKFWQFITKYRYNKEAKMVEDMKTSLMGKGISQEELAQSLTTKGSFVIAEGESKKYGPEYYKNKNSVLYKPEVKTFANEKEAKKAQILDDLHKAVRAKIEQMQGINLEEIEKNPVVMHYNSDDYKKAAPEKTESVKPHKYTEAEKEELMKTDPDAWLLDTDEDTPVVDPADSVRAETPSRHEEYDVTFAFGYYGNKFNPQKIQIDDSSSVIDDSLENRVATVYNNLNLKGLPIEKLDAEIDRVIEKEISPNFDVFTDIDRFAFENDRLEENPVKEELINLGEKENEKGEKFKEIDLENEEFLSKISNDFEQEVKEPKQQKKKDAPVQKPEKSVPSNDK